MTKTRPFLSVFSTRIRRSMFVVAITLVTVGCMKQDKAVNEQTPDMGDGDEEQLKRVVETMHKAVMHEDLNLFLRCYPADERYRPLQREIFRNLVLCYRFQDALLKAYGKEGLDDFTDLRTLKRGMGFFPSLPPTDEPWWEDLEFSIDGSAASCYDPWKRDTKHFVRNNGQWFIDLSKLVPRPEDDIRLARTLNSGYEATLPEIGKPGVTVDDIRRKLGERW